MERVLPEAAQEGIQKLIEYAYSFEPYFAPTVVLGELPSTDIISSISCNMWSICFLSLCNIVVMILFYILLIEHMIFTQH